jgi:hypothetical protein
MTVQHLRQPLLYILKGKKMKIIYLILLSLLLSLPLSAQNKWNFDDYKVPADPINEFQALAYFYTHMVNQNYYAENDLLKGQIVGRLFSSNTTITGGGATYFEQRLIPFFIYQPKLLNNRAILRASFEIDWTWGDASYGVGGNFGSAFNADQVNIQTQNVELELIPAKNWAINLGLQRLFDTPYNPYRTTVGTMANTAYRLMYWGSDGVGISLRHDGDYSRFKAGFYQLYENNVHQIDDVTLSEAIYEQDITPLWRQGVSFWYLYDRGNGEGGVSVLGQGLTSLLNDYNGTFKFNLGGRPYHADLFWLGTYGNVNPEFTLGRWTFNAFAVANFGTVSTFQTDSYKKAVDVLGLGSNLRTGYKYGQTAEDAVTLDVLFATGDEDGLKDEKYNGVITGNTWGSPGGLNIATGSYILYPHGNVVNRYIAAIADLSNTGLGQIGGTLNFSKSIIPNKFYAKVGLAAAQSLYEPEDGGRSIGTEANIKIAYLPAVFMNIELHGAYLWLGDFYDSPKMNGNKTVRPENPYTVFLLFKWLMF